MQSFWEKSPDFDSHQYLQVMYGHQPFWKKITKSLLNFWWPPKFPVTHSGNIPPQGYRNPLTGWLQNVKEGERFVRGVFLNWGELVRVHRQLLRSLQDTASDPWEFGQVFVNAVSFLSFLSPSSLSLSLQGFLMCLKVLHLLKLKFHSSLSLSTITISQEDDFSQYTEYCTNFNSANDLLRQTTDTNPDLKAYLEVSLYKIFVPEKNLSILSIGVQWNLR